MGSTSTAKYPVLKSSLSLSGNRYTYIGTNCFTGFQMQTEIWPVVHFTHFYYCLTCFHRSVACVYYVYSKEAGYCPVEYPGEIQKVCFFGRLTDVDYCCRFCKKDIQ